MNFKLLIIFVSIVILSTGITQSEVFPNVKGFDKYGGYLSIRGESKGKFYLDIIDGKHWVDVIRELPSEAAGKNRYLDYLKMMGDKASDEGFLIEIAKEVYSCIGPLTRKHFPETLIFGERYPGRLIPQGVIKEALPYIDVVSVQSNGSIFPKDLFDKLYAATKKPIMICDHQISFKTPDHKVLMWKNLASVEAVGEAHKAYMNEGFATPYLIGYNLCQYIDRLQHKRGRLVLKQGLLQADGKPYRQLVETVEENNWCIHKAFLEK